MKKKKKKSQIPQKSIWVGRKPSAPQGCPAISGAEPGLNSDEPKNLRALHQAPMISELPRTGGRIKCPESVFGSAASEDGHGSGAAEGRDGEDCAGEAEEEAEE
jgi:hypothetical protein